MDANELDMAIQAGSVPYVLIWRTDKIWLVGPFTSYDDAGAWGSANGYGADDNPCWQLVCLPKTHDRRLPLMDPKDGFKVPA